MKSTPEPKSSSALKTYGLIFIAHLAILFFALVIWNYKTDGIFHLLGNIFMVTRQEQKVLLKYGLGMFILYTITYHAISFWLYKKQPDLSYLQALAKLAPGCWPVSILLITLIDFITPFTLKIPSIITLQFEALKMDLILLLLIATAALTTGEVTRKFLEAITPKDTDAAVEIKPHKKWLIATTVAALFYTIYFSYFSIMRLLSVNMNTHDLSLYDQVLWNVLHGNGFRCTLWQSEIIGYDLMRFGFDYNAEHFMPTMLIMMPIFAVFQHTSVLLIFQSLLLGFTAIPLFYIALKKVKIPYTAFFFAVAYLAHPIVQHTNMKEFHMDAFVPFFLLGTYALFLHQKNIWYWIFIILALGCKEDVGLSVTFLGMFLIIGERKWKIGLATMFVGFLYGFFVIQYLIPYFRDGEPLRQLYRFHHLLPAAQQADPNFLMTPADLVKACLTRPFHVFEQVVDQDRFISILKLAIPFALFLLCSGWIIIWTIPPLTSNLLSNWKLQYTLTLHYGIAIVIPFAAASIWGFARWTKLLKIEENQYPLKHKPRIVGATVALCIGAYLIQSYFGYFPQSNRYPEDKYIITEHAKNLKPFLEAIPEDAALSANVKIGTLTAHRKTLYLFPDIHDAEYIIIDTRGPWWPILSQDDFKVFVNELLTKGEWGLKIPYHDGYLLFKKGHDTTHNQEALGNLNYRTGYRK